MPPRANSQSQVTLQNFGRDAACRPNPDIQMRALLQRCWRIDCLRGTRGYQRGAWRRHGGVVVLEPDDAPAYNSNECCMQCCGYQRAELGVSADAATEECE